MAQATQQEDPLLKELNGALSQIERGDPSNQPPIPGQKFESKGKVAGDPDLELPPSLSEQLNGVKNAKPQHDLTRAKLADKGHSKAAGAFGFRVVVKGDYIARSDDAKGKIFKPYSIPFNLPALVNSKGESALGIIIGASRPGGGMLRAALLKLDPHAVTYHTHEIASVEPLNGAPEPTAFEYMSFDALKEYVRKNCDGFPVSVDEYFNIAHLREDAIDFITNAVTDVTFERGTLAESKLKGGFGLKKSPSDRILERHAERKEQAELAAMNEGVL